MTGQLALWSLAGLVLGIGGLLLVPTWARVALWIAEMTR